MNKILLIIVFLMVHYCYAQPQILTNNVITQQLDACSQFSITLPHGMHLEKITHSNGDNMIYMRVDEHFPNPPFEINHRYFEGGSAEALKDLYFSLSCVESKSQEILLWPYTETFIEDDSNYRAVETWELKKRVKFKSANSHGEMVIIDHGGIQAWFTQIPFCLAAVIENHQLCGAISINNATAMRHAHNENQQQEILDLFEATIMDWLQSIELIEKHKE